MTRQLGLLLSLLISPFVFAEVPTWHLSPNESSIQFTATQNNAPISGKFTSFSADIVFDDKQLQQSKINFSVDISSLHIAFQEVAELLKTADWLAASAFPQATFSSSNIIKMDLNTFQASGKLTIKEKVIPTEILFIVEKKSNTQLHVKGDTIIKRTAFGIGQGEWSNTNNIKDDVKVKFDLMLNPS